MLGLRAMPYCLSSENQYSRAMGAGATIARERRHSPAGGPDQAAGRDQGVQQSFRQTPERAFPLGRESLDVRFAQIARTALERETRAGDLFCGVHGKLRAEFAACRCAVGTAAAGSRS